MDLKFEDLFLLSITTATNEEKMPGIKSKEKPET